MTHLPTNIRLAKPVSSLHNYIVVEGHRSTTFELDSEIFTVILQHLRAVFFQTAGAFADEHGVKMSNDTVRVLAIKMATHLAIYRDAGRFSCSPAGIADLEEYLWRKFHSGFEMEYERDVENELRRLQVTI
jgi:hypothetical protein